VIDRTLNQLLHAVTRAALRVQGPRAAKRTLQSVAQFLPHYSTMREASHALEELGGTGTCLSRSLTVASRLHGAEVVIGVNPRLGAGLFAHAWLKREDECLDSQREQNLVEEIGRL
jgi:hypothetical protein